MRIIRGLIVAFSIYSRIPMPHFEWEEKDMRFNLCFLPFVGAVIGLLVYGAVYLADMLGLPFITKICLISVIPLLVTGGFHVDGYMDVKDALSSYKSKEEKLDILKDPHIGAFSVIGLVIYGLIWTGALGMICDRGDMKTFIPVSAVFVLSRIGTAIASVTIEKAKKSGMLSRETGSNGKAETAVMFAELILCLAFVCIYDVIAAVLMLMVLILFYVYYRHRAYKEFGGVTGDTAGYFVCVSELLMITALSLYKVVAPFVM